MFLIELEPGREARYESVDALASAIRRGEVGPKSRIFHRAASRWVSITVHPEFRKVAAERASAPLPLPTRNQWTYDNAEEEHESPVEDAVTEPPADPEQRRSSWRAALSRAFRHDPPSA